MKSPTQAVIEAGAILNLVGEGNLPTEKEWASLREVIQDGLATIGAKKLLEKAEQVAVQEEEEMAKNRLYAEMQRMKMEAEKSMSASMGEMLSKIPRLYNGDPLRGIGIGSLNIADAQYSAKAAR